MLIEPNNLVALDRDGIINLDYGYVYSQEKFVFQEGIIELCKFLKSINCDIAVVTNQSGIGRKYYSEEEFWTLTEWMLAKFDSSGAKISRVYHCPHLPVNGGEACECRKPQPGMLLQALNDLGHSATSAIIIGDKESDMVAGLNAGFGTRILVGSEESLHATHHFKSVLALLETING